MAIEAEVKQYLPSTPNQDTHIHMFICMKTSSFGYV